MTKKILVPEFFVDYGGRIHQGVIIIDNHRITHVGDGDHQDGDVISLKNQVVMPGFVNAHSHAFQRALRGLVERKPKGISEHNFFSWRNAMYGLAQKLSEHELQLIAELAYIEMLEAGFTHVGEFHYLHHSLNSRCKNSWSMSQSLARAAKKVGINLMLLECAYARSNFSEPLRPEQERFAFSSVKDFLAHVTDAKTNLTADYAEVGLAIHSVRAVCESWFDDINQFRDAHRMPLHIHASEQQAEIIACMAHHQLSPLALLAKHELLTPATTVVHATHLISGDAQLIAHHRPNICICPSTEKNLGDGVVPLKEFFTTTSICIGTDQHVRFDPFAEARSLEELERLRLMQRHVLNGEGEFLYESLLPCLNKNGMKSLYLNFAGDDLVGHEANLIAIELPPEYQWHGPKHALDALMIAGRPSSITTVLTKGEVVVQNGHTNSLDKVLLIKEIGKIFRSHNLS